MPKHTVEERFWSKVDKKTENECWEWLAYPRNNYYGSFRMGGKIRTAHRVAYELVKGPIPDGLQIDHLCRNKACVNPKHLEAVTPKINCQRATGKLICLNGHSRIKIKKNGTCLQCELERNAKVRANLTDEQKKIYNKYTRKSYNKHIEKRREESRLRMRAKRAMMKQGTVG